MFWKNGKLSLFAALIIILLLTVQFQVDLGRSATGAIPVSPGLRQPRLTIKLVFLGFNSSQIDTSYLANDLNTPNGKYQSVLQGGVNTGVLFTFNYQTVFASDSQTSDFVGNLTSGAVQEVQDRSAVNPPYTFNPYFQNATSGIRLVQNTFYNATRVEKYLESNIDSFGITPLPGYTLFIADLHKSLPSYNYTQYRWDQCQEVNPCMPQYTATVHYYNRTASDQDLGEEQSRHYMTAWGGNYRFYYIDISAGPSHWTGDLPVQVQAGRTGNITLSSPYGRQWLTQTVADYVTGAVFNLFAPDLLYPVSYSREYDFHLFVFDNRTVAERNLAGPSIDKTINTTMIKDQLTSLVPFAAVKVDAHYYMIDDYPELAKIIHDSAGLVDPNLRSHAVDARPVYDWLRGPDSNGNGQGNWKKFIPNPVADTSKIDIPAFVFAFTRDYNFGFTGKGDVFMTSETGTRSIFGVALGDMVLVSHGENDLNKNAETFLKHDVGVGFTATLTHEFGHMMGLNHPFIYDGTEDFSDTVMGYYTASTHFSQFDRDTVLRGIDDGLLGFAAAELAATPNNLFNSGSILSANNAINRANQEYEQMNYQGAVQSAVEAAVYADTARGLASLGFSPGLVFGLIGMAIGAIIGFIVALLILRERQARAAGVYAGAYAPRMPGQIRYGYCPTCGRALRWDPMMMHWYCDNCQHSVKL